MLLQNFTISKPVTSHRFSASDSAPKKYQNTGLRKDLKSKRAPEVQDMDVVDPFQSGGLNDEDIISVRPQFPRSTHNAAGHSAVAYPTDVQRDQSLRNKV